MSFMISFIWKYLKVPNGGALAQQGEGREGQDAAAPSQQGSNKRHKSRDGDPQQESSRGLCPKLWSRLPIDLVLRVVSCLPANEIACTARVLCKASAAHLGAPERRLVRLSQPVPPHAFDRRWGAPDTMRCMTLKLRRQLLLLTVSSGGPVDNLVVALEGVGLTGFRELDLYEAAARTGSMTACQLLWRQESGLPSIEQRDEAGMLAAAEAGKLDICIWLHRERYVPWAFARHHVMDVLAAAGHVMACKRLHEQERVPYTEAVLAAAARAGDLALCRTLRQAGCPCRGAAFKAAAAAGHQAICDWLLGSYQISRLDAAVAVAEAGQAGLLTKLLDDPSFGCCSGSGSASGGGGALGEWWHRVLAAAAAGCDLPTLQKLFQRASATAAAAAAVAKVPAGSIAAAATPSGGGAAAAAASSEGAGGGSGSVLLSQHLSLPANIRSKVLKAAADSLTDDWREKAAWLMGEPRGFRLAEGRVRGVRGGGGGGGGPAEADPPAEALERLLWLRDAGLRTEKPLDMEMAGMLFRMAAAAARGDGDAATLERLLGAHPVTVGRYAASTLAERGHWEVLLTLHSRGCHVSKDMVADVARTVGQVAAMEALLAALGPQVVLTPEVTRGSAESGSVELVEWLLGRGCKLDRGDGEVFAAAARGGSEEMLEWLAERGCSMGTDGAAYLAAAGNGDMRTLRCLRRLGCPFGRDTFAVACRRAALPALRWMVDEGFPVRLARARADASLRRGCSEVSEWLETLEGRAC